MDREYFHVDAGEYVPGKKFAVVRPASLGHPKSNAVMFVLEGHVSEANAALEEVRDCLVFWPAGLEAPKGILDRHAVVPCADPRLEYCRFFRDNGIDDSPKREPVEFAGGAFISPEAKIGSNVTIMPGAYVSGSCEIGDGSYIGCGVKLMGRVIVGRNVVIRENSVIGAVSLSTNREPDGTPVTMPQFGYVVLEDHVQVGANAVISRGAIDETRVCRYAKVDNASFVSHNCYVGENSFVVGNSHMMGSSTMGKNSLLSGNASVMNAIHIGDDAMVGMGAVVVKNVPDGATVKGNPAR